jgi:diguanylate cyclase (GGDEF)-like protein/PAS domain S-box-containing protein
MSCDDKQFYFILIVKNRYCRCNFSKDISTNQIYIVGAKKNFGVSNEEFHKNPMIWRETTHPEAIPLVTDMMQTVASGESAEFECRIITPDGKIRWIQYKMNPIFNSLGGVVKNNELMIDITERKKADEAIEHMAYHDALTGLPNLYMLNKYLKQAIERCEKYDQKLAIMFIDLDRFKSINDTLGHDIGDHLLKQIPERLYRNIDEGDFVSRQGGDEFLKLLEDTQEEEIDQVAQQILDEFSAPFALNDEEIFISPSIGIAIYPIDGQNADELLKKADNAMYLAKERDRREKVEFSTPSFSYSKTTLA